MNLVLGVNVEDVTCRMSQHIPNAWTGYFWGLIRTKWSLCHKPCQLGFGS